MAQLDEQRRRVEAIDPTKLDAFDRAAREYLWVRRRSSLADHGEAVGLWREDHPDTVARYVDCGGWWQRVLGDSMNRRSQLLLQVSGSSGLTTEPIWSIGRELELFPQAGPMVATTTYRPDGTVDVQPLVTHFEPVVPLFERMPSTTAERMERAVLMAEALRPYYERQSAAASERPMIATPLPTVRWATARRSQLEEAGSRLPRRWQEQLGRSWFVPDDAYLRRHRERGRTWVTLYGGLRLSNLFVRTDRATDEPRPQDVRMYNLSYLHAEPSVTDDPEAELADLCGQLATSPGELDDLLLVLASRCPWVNSALLRHYGGIVAVARAGTMADDGPGGEVDGWAQIGAALLAEVAWHQSTRLSRDRRSVTQRSPFLPREASWHPSGLPYVVPGTTRARLFPDDRSSNDHPERSTPGAGDDGAMPRWRRMYRPGPKRLGFGAGTVWRQEHTGRLVAFVGVNHTFAPEDPIHEALYVFLRRFFEQGDRPTRCLVEAGGPQGWLDPRSRRHRVEGGGEMIPPFHAALDAGDVTAQRFEPTQDQQAEALADRFGQDRAHYLLVGRTILQYLQQNDWDVLPEKGEAGLRGYLHGLGSSFWRSGPAPAWWNLSAMGGVHARLFDGEQMDLADPAVLGRLHSRCNWSEHAGRIPEEVDFLQRFRDEFIMEEVARLVDDHNVAIVRGDVHRDWFDRRIAAELQRHGADWRRYEIVASPCAGRPGEYELQVEASDHRPLGRRTSPVLLPSPTLL